MVLVLENGRPLDLRWAAEHVPAILEAWYPGTEGGDAVADVLFGDVTPGGKLPLSWPRVAGAEPLYYNHNLTHDPDDRPNFTSRYWDISSKPLYPFGYGLSYTTFKFANLHLSPEATQALNPPITWFGWEVPIALQIFTVFALGMIMLGIAIAEFNAGD